MEMNSGSVAVVLAMIALGLGIWALVKIYVKPKKVKAGVTVVAPLESPFAEERTGTSHFLTFRPNGGTIKSPETFSEWSDLMSTLANVDGPVVINFESSPSLEILIPAGTYDMTGVTWSCTSAVFVPSADITGNPEDGNNAHRVVIRLADGVVLQNLTAIMGPMLIRCMNTSTPNMILEKEGSIFIIDNGVALVGSDSDENTQPFVQFKKSELCGVSIGRDCVLLRGAGNVHLVDVLAADGGTDFDVTINGSLVGRDEFTVEAGTTVRLYFTGLLKTNSNIVELDFPIVRVALGQLDGIASACIIEARDLTMGAKKLQGTATTAPSALTLAKQGLKVGDMWNTSNDQVYMLKTISANESTLTWIALS